MFGVKVGLSLGTMEHYGAFGPLFWEVVYDILNVILVLCFWVSNLREKNLRTVEM